MPLSFAVSNAGCFRPSARSNKFRSREPRQLVAIQQHLVIRRCRTPSGHEDSLPAAAAADQNTLTDDDRAERDAERPESSEEQDEQPEIPLTEEEIGREKYFKRKRAFGRFARSNRIQVGIVGGGMAGLMCASRLLRLGDVDVTVWDRGRAACGGRAVSGTYDQGRFVFDYGAQLFTAEDPRFIEVAEAWRRLGIAKKWEAWNSGRVGVLEMGTYRPLPDDAAQPYVGVPDMGAIAKFLSARLVIRQNKIITRIERREGLWDMFTGRGPRVGTYDAVVVAHTGKSAAKLTSRKDAPTLNRLAQHMMVQAPSEEQVLQRAPIWSIMFAFKKKIDIPVDAAFVRKSRVLSWVSNNTAKLEKPFEGAECWTLLSTRAFAVRNLTTPSGAPRAFAERIADDMLREFEELIGFPEESLRPIYWRAQYWPDALPVNVLKGAEFVWDDEINFGMCGDWCVKPGIEGAAISGIELADRLHASLIKGEKGISVGLDASFEPLTKITGIGHVAGLDADDVSSPLARTAIRGRML